MRPRRPVSRGLTALPPLPTSTNKQRFRRRLLEWYRRNGRDLPWRRTSDPYHILVSEVMLQQTQVDRVLPKYHEWLGKYPTLEALASAPEADVATTWRPLGYVHRDFAEPGTPVEVSGSGEALVAGLPFVPFE